MPASITGTGTATQADGAATGTITLTIPGAATDGDLLVLWVAARGLSTAGATTISTPSGWTKLGTTQVYSITSTGRLGSALFWRRHSSGSPTVTVTYGAAYVNVGEAVGVGVTVISGAPGSPWTGTVAEGITATDATAPDPSPTQRAMILAHYAKAGTIAISPDHGFTAAYGNSVSPSGAGLAFGAHYLTADPGTYTMPTTRHVRSSVAVIDRPAGGIYFGLPVGGGGIVAAA